MAKDPLLRYSARVAWSGEDKAFIAQCPEFPRITAFGANSSEAVAELEQALLLAVETHEQQGWPVPIPVHEPQFSGQFRLRIPRSLHGWLSVKAQEEGVSLNTLVAGYLAEARGSLNHEGGTPPTKRAVELLG
jgi:predicted HicB family RNase H-like nuclease